MFKISHEVPIDLLDKSLSFNDYEYCLAHIYQQNEKYREFYDWSANSERVVILDNSAYELGEPMSGALYLDIIKKLRPSEYIIPDWRDDAAKNLQGTRDWITEAMGAGITAKRIGVVHGESYLAFCKNYRALLPFVDKIAFSFESFFTEWAEIRNLTLAEARISILRTMIKDKVIRLDKPHHILGALSPTEFKSYENWNWIESVDTSNPVLHGLLGFKYQDDFGLNIKSPVKLDSLMNKTTTEEQFKIVMYNVEWFRDQFNDRRRTPYLNSLTPSFSLSTPKEKKYDEVKADHYRAFPIETIELMRRIWGDEKTANWCEVTAFKYRMRLGYKPTSSVDIDLKKEKWYLDKAEELRKES